MSLEIIEYTHNDANSISEIIATIKQRTGLELTSLGDAYYEAVPFNVRFPDMEESQKINIQTFTFSGTFFIDATNHFLCYTVGNGMDDYRYVDNLYRAIVYDFNGLLANVSMNTERNWNAMNIDMYNGGYLENDYSKNDITLVPLRVYGCNHDNDSTNRKYGKGFIKNCYVNYERKFQRNLKFIDQNRNEFITLGGYLLYYNGKHK